MAASDPRRSTVAKMTQKSPISTKAKSVDTRGKKGLTMNRNAVLDVARRASLSKTRNINTVSNRNKSLILDPIDFGRNFSTPVKTST